MRRATSSVGTRTASAASPSSVNRLPSSTTASHRSRSSASTAVGSSREGATAEGAMSYPWRGSRGVEPLYEVAVERLLQLERHPQHP